MANVMFKAIRAETGSTSHSHGRMVHFGVSMSEYYGVSMLDRVNRNIVLPGWLSGAALLGALLLMLGAFVLLDTEQHARRMNGLQARGIPTQARIVLKYETEDRQDTRYTIEGTFPAGAGDTPFKMDIPQGLYEQLETGQDLALVYDPQDGSNIALASAVDGWNAADYRVQRLSGIGVLYALLLAAGGGAWMLFQRRRHARGRETVEAGGDVS